MLTGHSSVRALRRSVFLSFLLHATALAVLAALLQPAGNGPNRPLVIEASTPEPLPEPETLVISDALILPNAGELLTEEDTDHSAIAGQRTDFVSSELQWPTGLGGAGTSQTRKQGSGPGTSFFGTVAYGNQFVYVVDISTSNP